MTYAFTYLYLSGMLMSWLAYKRWPEDWKSGKPWQRALAMVFWFVAAGIILVGGVVSAYKSFEDRL